MVLVVLVVEMLDGLCEVGVVIDWIWFVVN